jgi:hypothetical protein
VRKAAEKYAQLYHEYETGVSDDIDEDEVTTSEAVSDALDALVGRVLILARKVSSK